MGVAPQLLSRHVLTAATSFVAGVAAEEAGAGVAGAEVAFASASEHPCDLQHEQNTVLAIN